MTLLNDNATEKFYRFLWFRKVDIFGRNSKNLEKLKNSLRGALLLYELSERDAG